MHSMMYTPEQIAQMEFETAQKALEQLVVSLERGQLSLADSIKGYRIAQQLKVHVMACLENAEDEPRTLEPSAS